MKRFPVMVGVSGGFSIPWDLVAPFERQARSNHGQSLQRLAERGGLSPRELWAVMHAKSWREAEAGIDLAAAHAHGRKLMKEAIAADIRDRANKLSKGSCALLMELAEQLERAHR